MHKQVKRILSVVLAAGLLLDPFQSCSTLSTVSASQTDSSTGKYTYPYSTKDIAEHADGDGKHDTSTQGKTTVNGMDLDYWYNNDRYDVDSGGGYLYEDQNGNNKYSQTRYQYICSTQKIKDSNGNDTDVSIHKTKDDTNKDGYKYTETDLSAAGISPYYETCIFSQVVVTDTFIITDALNNVVIQNVSKDRVTNNFYRTIGYTFSRVKANGQRYSETYPTEPSKWVEVSPKSDNSGSSDYKALYGSDPHYTTSSGKRAEFTVYLSSDMYEEDGMAYEYTAKRIRNGETQLKNVTASAYHTKKYKESQKKGLDAIAVAGCHLGNGRTINTWVYSGDDLFGEYSEARGNTQRADGTYYSQSWLWNAFSENDGFNDKTLTHGKASWYYQLWGLYGFEAVGVWMDGLTEEQVSAMKEYYAQVTEAMQERAGVLRNAEAWFAVDAVIEWYADGEVTNEGNPQTYTNPTYTRYEGIDVSGQYNLYFKWGKGGAVGDTTEYGNVGTMLVEKNPYDEDTSNIPTSTGFTETAAIPNSSGEDHTTPDVYAQNVSNDYDLGTAIPTSETYTSTLLEDTWYGCARIQKNECTIQITIPWRTTYQYWVPTDDGGYYAPATAWGNITCDMTADNYTISDIDFAQLTDTTLTESKNEDTSWSSGKFKNLNAVSVPISFVTAAMNPDYWDNDDAQDKENYPKFLPAGYDTAHSVTKGSDFSISSVGSEQLENYYFVKPDNEYQAMTTASNYQTFAGYFSSYSQGQNYSEKWAQDTAQNYVQEFLTEWKKNITNDTLVINGTVYLEGQHMITGYKGDECEVDGTTMKAKSDAYKTNYLKRINAEEDAKNLWSAKPEGTTTTLRGTTGQNPEDSEYSGFSGKKKTTTASYYDSGSAFGNSQTQTESTSISRSFSGSVTIQSHMVSGDKTYVAAKKSGDKYRKLTFNKDKPFVIPVEKWTSYSSGISSKERYALGLSESLDLVGDRIEDNPHGIVTQKTVTIPTDTANGIYYTKIDATYKMFGYIKNSTKKKTRHLIVDDRQLTDSEKESYGIYPAIIGKDDDPNKQENDSYLKKNWTYTDDNGKKTTNDAQHNEGIRVHSPVLSPVSIEGEDKTQLINPDTSVTAEGGAQMILDNEYTLTFDWDTYFKQKAKYVKGYDGNRDSSGSLIPSAGWTKFLSDKRIRFPYSVEIRSYTTLDDDGNKETHELNKYFEPVMGSTDTRYYDAEQNSGQLSTDSYDVQEDGTDYTAWIKLPADTISIDIYIPSWAEEGSYVPESMYDSVEHDKYAQIKRCIEVEVRANNYSTETSKEGQDIISTRFQRKNEETGQEAEGNNADIKKGKESYKYYGATYEYPTELSGVIYGFQINAVNDPFHFLGTDKVSDSAYWVNLVKNKMEKKVGMFNRASGPVLRYTLDGTTVDTSVTPEQNTNTLPLTSGKSDVAKRDGFLMRGSNFSFLIKTIADLQHTDDKIVITPTFRYVAADGSSKEVALYYDNPDGTGYYTGETREDDSDMKSVRLWDEDFQKCFYDYDKTLDTTKSNYDTTYYTAAYYLGQYYDSVESAHRQYMDSSYQAYRLNRIEIPSGLKELTGNEEELKSNLTKSVNDVDRLVISNEDDTQSIINTGNFTVTQSEYDDMADSMQTWYCRYRIPSSLKIVDVQKVRDYCATAVVDNQGHLYTYDETLDPYMNYILAKGYSDPDDDIFINEGYLILNFDIKTYKNDGTYAHLQYYADNAVDMWSIEQGDPDDPTITVTDIDPPVTVPGESGDVAVITLYQKLDDYYSAGVIYAD